MQQTQCLHCGRSKSWWWVRARGWRVGSGFHKSLLIFPCECVYSHMLERDCLGVCTVVFFFAWRVYTSTYLYCRAGWPQQVKSYWPTNRKLCFWFTPWFMNVKTGMTGRILSSMSLSSSWIPALLPALFRFVGNGEKGDFNLSFNGRKRSWFKVDILDELRQSLVGL